MSGDDKRGLDEALLDLRLEIVRRSLECSGLKLGRRGEALVRAGIDLNQMRPNTIHPLSLCPRGLTGLLRWSVAWTGAAFSKFYRTVSLRTLAKGLAYTTLALLLLACIPFVTGCSDDSPGSQSVNVERVIDGDTIVLSTGDRVRYIGIDTPELRAKDPTIRFWARRAHAANEILLLGAQVHIVLGVDPRDRYGRLLAYVYADGEFVNLQLIEQGLATTMTITPNVDYAADFQAAELEARRLGHGMWSQQVIR